MGARLAVIYLLDANVLIDFQESALLRELVQASHVVEMAVAEKVFDEVTLPKQGDSGDAIGKKRAAAKLLCTANISKIGIMPGTPQAELLEALAPLKSLKEKDRGEAASIAVAFGNNRLVLVTGDNKAALWALNELFGSGERLMRVPVFVRSLFERGALSAAAVKGIADRAAGHGAKPTWWNSWLGGI
jgi:predicted nucleic acid-binding protein